MPFLLLLALRWWRSRRHRRLRLWLCLWLRRGPRRWRGRVVVVGRTTADVAFERCGFLLLPTLAIAIPRVAGAITLRQQHFYARSVRTNPWAHITTGVVGTCWSTCTTAWGVLGKHAAQEFRRALVHGSWTADTPMLLLSGVAKHCTLLCPTREAGVQCLGTTPGCSW